MMRASELRRDGQYTMIKSELSCTKSIRRKLYRTLTKLKSHPILASYSAQDILRYSSPGGQHTFSTDAVCKRRKDYHAKIHGRSQHNCSKRATVDVKIFFSVRGRMGLFV
jgi:hypothetical protein